jgi:hypothetical protein
LIAAISPSVGAGQAGSTSRIVLMRRLRSGASDFRDRS